MSAKLRAAVEPLSRSCTDALIALSCSPLLDWSAVRLKAATALLALAQLYPPTAPASSTPKSAAAASADPSGVYFERVLFTTANTRALVRGVDAVQHQLDGTLPATASGADVDPDDPDALDSSTAAEDSKYPPPPLTGDDQSAAFGVLSQLLSVLSCLARPHTALRKHASRVLPVDLLSSALQRVTASAAFQSTVASGSPAASPLSAATRDLLALMTALRS